MSAWRGKPVANGDQASPGHVVKRERLYRRSLALADVCAAGLAIAIVVPSGWGKIEAFALLALPLVALVSKVSGLYDRDELVVNKTTLEEAPPLFQLATLCTLLIWLVKGSLLAGGLGKAHVLGLWGLLFLFLLVARTIARRAVGVVAPPERCLLIGDGATYARVAGKFERNGSTKARLIGHIQHLGEIGEAARRNGEPDVSDLESLVDELGVHRLIVAPGNAESDHVLELIETAKALGVRVSVLPRVFEVVGSSVEFDHVDGEVLLGVRRFGLTRSSWAIKRAVDVAVSVVALIVLAPLLAVTALTIKLESRGPVFFRQTRIGRGGHPFSMLKFRSMVDGADRQKIDLHALNESDGLFKIALDPRVTRVGRWLRAASLDELPQLWNVLRGEMSLVGPRPLVPEEDERIERWHRGRVQLTPGMTGHWQVLGAARVPLNEMVAMDYLYAANWSLWLDAQLLLRTIPHVLKRQGI